MRNKKYLRKKKRKFKLLLDSAFANKNSFPLLSKKANITHIVHTYRYSPTCSDQEIYNKAVQEERFVITINYKDFRKLVKVNKSGIIGIPAELSNKQIDKLLSSFVTRNNPEDYYGKTIKLTEQVLKNIRL